MNLLNAEVEFRHFHLFCGLGGGAKGFNRSTSRVGKLRGSWRCVGGVDVDRAAIADFSRAAGVPGTVLDLFSEEQFRAFHGKAPPSGWREATRLDILRAAHQERPNSVFLSAPCLPASGIVITEAGPRPISSIRQGDRVLTHRGRMREVTAVGTHRYVGEMHGIRLNGTVDHQWYTDEHPILVRRVTMPAANGKKRQLGEAKFIPAKNVRVGDRVGFPVERAVPATAQSLIDALGDPRLALRGGAAEGGYRKSAHVAVLDRVIDLRCVATDERLWFLIGAYLGDGYRRKTGGYVVSFCVGARMGPLSSRVCSALDSLGIPYSIDADDGETNVRIRAQGKHLHMICGLFGDGADQKRLPPEIFGLEDHLVEALIDGYRGTDGSDQGRRPGGNGNTLQARWKIPSVSLQLLRDVQRLLLRQGIYASIHKCWPGGGQVIMGRSVQTKERWELNVRLDPVKRTVFEFADGAAWVRVREVVRRKTDERVWNLSVDEDDTFCSPMIATHNCKGFSGLLPEKSSGTDKYQALNGLTLRGVWLMLETWKDDPVELIVFENVPRIMTRGRHLLDQIVALLRSYGYAVAETTHDCGEIGGLGQSRKRFLLVARHEEKVPPFLYEPEKRRLRGVGEILERLPLPGDLRAGPMHRMPALQWKTWVRLAFVEAGSDWRSLNKLEVENGVLRDFGILPDVEWQASVLGVLPWGAPSGVIAGRSSPTNGAYSVADPRFDSGGNEYSQYGVRQWTEPMGAVINVKSPGQGTFAVSDPRIEGKPRFNNVFRIVPWSAASPAVAGPGGPAGGLAVADPRPAPRDDYKQTKYRVTSMEEPAGTVIAASTTGNGAFAVADPRPVDQLRSGAHGVRQWQEASGTVQGESLPSNGAFAVADPRPGYGDGAHQNILAVTEWDRHSKTIAGSKHVAGGALSVADPRPTHGPNAHQNKMAVVDWDDPSKTVTGSDRVGSGALSVADPRPVGLNANRENYKTGGHYGVVPWGETGYAVPGYAKYDRGHWSVADPREPAAEPLQELPKAGDRLVAVIRALDGTWHRPFTTLELAALQSLVDPDDITAGFSLDGQSDSAWRERIGNAVPPDAAEAIAGVMGTTLLLAMTGETFMLSNQPIWVRDVAMALAVDERGNIPVEDHFL